MIIIPPRLLSEDAADMTIREYLCLMHGWQVAFYSPPHGSWSKIRVEVDGFLYESYSPRDIKRPDIVLYKKEKDGLCLILIESKGAIGSFTKSGVTAYVKEMSEYADFLINGKYRLIKNTKTGALNENEKLPENIRKNITFKIGLLACSINIKEDCSVFKTLLPQKPDVFGLCVEVDWEKASCKIQSINDCTGYFSKNSPIIYSY